MGVTSGTSKPSSWINVFAYTTVDTIKGVFKFISSPFKVAVGMEHSRAITVQGIDANSTFFLLDVLMRKITGQEYIFTADQPISLSEARACGLSITEWSKNGVEQAGLKSGVSMHRLNIDFMEIQKEVTGKIMSGKFDEISGILNSYVEKGCPGREAEKLSSKKFDKFMIEFNSRLNIVLNQSIQQILHSRDSTLEVDGAKKQQMNLEPQSYLSNASVQGHLTRDKVKLIS